MSAATSKDIHFSNQIPPTNIYVVGALKYDHRSLVVLFGWLLWGDFAFNFFEQVFGRFMPLYLDDLKASNTLIGITTGSIAGMVNILFLPNISQWCDRLRTRWGRRIPMLLVMAPLTTLSLLGVGYAPEIGTWLHDHVTAGLVPWLSSTTLLLSLLCIFSVAFHFFNMALVNAYNWLLRDVVPQVIMARFLSWFRIVGNVAGVLFLWYVFPTMISHRKETFLTVAVFYIFAFTMMCWKVKEGDYPAPEPHVEGSNLLTRFGAYFRDCLALPIYRNFFIAYVLVVVGTNSAGSFITLYTRNTLHLTMDEMGHYGAYTIVFSSLLLIPAGWLCDKLSPIKIVLFSLIVITLTPLCAYLFVDNKAAWLGYSLLSQIPAVGWGLGSVALSMTLFPDRVFGQFSAGMNVFGCGGMIFGNYLAGVFMDATHGNFRFIFLWSVLFYAIAIIPMYLVYRDWKKFGGQKKYIAPVPVHMLQD